MNPTDFQIKLYNSERNNLLKEVQEKNGKGLLNLISTAGFQTYTIYWNNKKEQLEDQWVTTQQQYELAEAYYRLALVDESPSLSLKIQEKDKLWTELGLLQEKIEKLKAKIFNVNSPLIDSKLLAKQEGFEKKIVFFDTELMKLHQT